MLKMFYQVNKKINAVKNLAFNVAQKGFTFQELVHKTQIQRDSDIGGKSGIYAEVILAWMCGVFKRYNPNSFDVEMSVVLDHRYKTDFLVKRFDARGMWHEQKMQVKFNNDNLFCVPDDVTLVHLAPDLEAFRGVKHCNGDMNGTQAFVKFLTMSNLYTRQEVYNLCLSDHILAAAFNRVWKRLTD